MPLPTSDPLAILSEHLSSRRDAIMLAWRKSSGADPEQTTAHSLTLGQFNDHIPEVLDALELRLRSRPGSSASNAATADQKKEEVKHGLHRWQQGYRLQELMNEWGHLQRCVFEELVAFAADHPTFARETLVESNRQLISFINDAISESACQYERMEQAEAAGHVSALMIALANVNEIEQRRAALIHQAVHDLGNNVFGVRAAANLLGETLIADTERVEFATLLQKGMQGVTETLSELMDLARLEAGQEQREISGFDAALLATDLCDFNQPVARARGLYLNASGPSALPVLGDPVRVRRLLQNLVTNALKYTVQGGVTVGWGIDKQTWWLLVEDTGPGLASGSSAPLAAGLKEATASARHSDEKTAASEGTTSEVLTPPAQEDHARRPTGHRKGSGEGIGLSIVKRLCELLDASLELATSAETGTTFRVVLPVSYDEAADTVPSAGPN